MIYIQDTQSSLISVKESTMCYLMEPQSRPSAIWSLWGIKEISDGVIVFHGRNCNFLKDIKIRGWLGGWRTLKW